MKSPFIVLTLLILAHCGFAQKEDIEIFEKKDGNKNIVVARNTGKVAYLVTVSIEAKGMDVTPSMKVEAVVPAGFMKEMATLVPRPGESWSYGYDVSFVENSGKLPNSPATPNSAVEAKPSQPALASAKPASKAEPTAPPAAPTPASITPASGPTVSTDAAIIVYTQAGCGRCAFVRKEMKAKGIAFQEVDVNSGSAEVNTMWMELRQGGFTGESVTMPVVKVDGKLHYNIKDLAGFVNNIKS